MRLTSLPNVFGIDPWSSETVQQLPLGTIGYDYYNNAYRYGLQNSGAAAVAGDVYQSVPQPTNFADLAVPTAVALRSTSTAPSPNNSIVVTLGGTAATVNQFAGGRAVVSTSAGIGTQYTIASNVAQTSTTGALTVVFEENIITALTTSSKVTLTPHPYNGVVIAPTTITGFTAGIALIPVPAGSYGWYGTHGVFGALADATTAAVGNGLSPSVTTAGTITKAITLKDSIGYCIVATVSAQVEPEWFNIN